jgi:hypothetical protein
MRKLLLVLLAFFAVFTFIRAFDKAEAGEKPPEAGLEISREIPVEIVR